MYVLVTEKFSFPTKIDPTINLEISDLNPISITSTLSVNGVYRVYSLGYTIDSDLIGFVY